MATDLVLNPLPTPPNTCIPGTADGIIGMMAQYLQIVQKSATQVLTSVNYGSTTPSVSNQDVPWIRLDSNGQPIGTFVFFNGKWIRSLDYPIGFIAMYNGLMSNFDGTGKGVQGTQADSWSICNGSNNTPDMQNRFPVGANAYSGGWITDVNPNNTGSTVGGHSAVTINRVHLPELTANFAASNNQGSSGSTFVRGGTKSGDDIVDNVTNGTNNPLVTLPPYLALAFIRFDPFVYN